MSRSIVFLNILHKIQFFHYRKSIMVTEDSFLWVHSIPKLVFHIIFFVSVLRSMFHIWIYLMIITQTDHIFVCTIYRKQINNPSTKALSWRQFNTNEIRLVVFWHWGQSTLLINIFSKKETKYSVCSTSAIHNPH